MCLAQSHAARTRICPSHTALAHTFPWDFLPSLRFLGWNSLSWLATLDSVLLKLHHIKETELNFISQFYHLRPNLAPNGSSAFLPDWAEKQLLFRITLGTEKFSDRRGPSTWAILLCFPRYISKELDWSRTAGSWPGPLMECCLLLQAEPQHGKP